ncbi:MAG: HEAT repeat domain-containing protein [Planctomycetes bacterium]|nr:HEAT repeat domain-containing protein [Planctomycetota bacterium]
MQKDKDDYVRRLTIFALGELGDERAISPLEEVIREDNDPKTREKCKEAIAKLKSAATRPGLSRQSASSQPVQSATSTAPAGHQD